MGRKIAWGVLVVLAIGPFARAAEPLASGPEVGSEPGMYPVVLSTGPDRGKPTCLFCAAGSRPAVAVFVRTPNDLSGKLAAKLDKALADHKAAQLRSWIVFISKDPDALDAQLVRWSRQLNLRSLPVGIYVDPNEEGPENYRLARWADVTVVMLVKQKVTATFAFREDELTDEAVQRVSQAVGELFDDKP
jgi:hypothetical protein